MDKSDFPMRYWAKVTVNIMTAGCQATSQLTWRDIQLARVEGSQGSANGRSRGSAQEAF